MDNQGDQVTPAPPPQPPKPPLPQSTAAETPREQTQKAFRQYLRQADKYIVDHKFELARTELAEAKKLDPTNPFIIAFEERIALFQKKITPGKQPPVAQQQAAPAASPPPPKAEKSPVSPPASPQADTRAIEQQIRRDIETEYKQRFTQEIQKAEILAAKVLEEERRQIEQQRSAMQKKFDEQVADARHRLEQEFQKKLDEELRNAEQRLEERHQAELALIENEMKSGLKSQYDETLRVHEEQARKEREQMLDAERETARLREHQLNEKFNRQLQDALGKSEQEVQQQLQEQKKKEEELLRKQLAAEFQASLARERDGLKKQYEILKQQMEQALVAERRKLESEGQLQLKQQVEQVRRTQTEELEKKQTVIRKELEEELARTVAAQYQKQIQEAEEKARREREAVVAKERAAYEEREAALRKQFDQKLLDSLRKTETLFREQSVQQQRVEEEKLRRQLTADFQKELEHERSTMTQKYESMKKALEQAFQSEREKLTAAAAVQLQEQLEGLRKKHKEEFERQRVELPRQVEAELSRKFQTQLEEERRRIGAEAAAAVDAEKKRHAAERDALIRAENEKIQKVRADLRQEMEGNFLARLERVAEEYDNKMALLGAQIPEKQEDRLKLYRSRMQACYTDGAPSVDSARMLMQLKELLELTFDDHLAVEADVRMDLYARTIEKKILSGEIDLQHRELIDALKAQFSLSAEEETNLEPYILSCFQRTTARGRILVVDDDLLLLRAVEDLLSAAGFQVMTAPDVAAALEKLKNAPVDLILSDIRFGDSDLDGFKFFKAVQAKPDFRNIPFVFMSSLKDGAIIQSGMQLGVDDYLTKPIDDDLMVAVIDGKLKRYRSFQRN